jgi:glycosyltransferase involved in cell wall biosynthesis
MSRDAAVIHADGPLAARVVYLHGRGLYRLVVSGADRPGCGFVGWLTRRAIRAADSVVARTTAEAERYHCLGVRPDRIELIPPGVSPASPPPDPTEFRSSLNIPEDGRLVIAAGRFDADADLRSAVWAFDMVKYAIPDLYLVLAGDGPERDRVEHFARAVGYDDYRVRFTGDHADRSVLYGLADVAWVTHRRGGVCFALQAMSACRPVVAVHTSDLVEVIEHGVTGLLVRPADRVELAAATRELLSNPEQARRLGAAGQARIAERFQAAAVAERYGRLYEMLISG